MGTFRELIKGTRGFGPQICYGGGGSTTSTVNQQTIPKQFYPYFERMLIRGEEASLQPYLPYGGERIAGQTQDTLDSQQMIRDLAGAGSPELDAALGDTAGNAGAAAALAGQDPYQFSMYGGFDGFDFSPFQKFDASAANEYMSPYISEVLDLQKARAEEDYRASRAGRNAAAVAAGAFGGSRQAVAESLAERDMLTRMREIDATGMQSAYENAQRMFEADRQARLQLEQALAGEGARVQSGEAGEYARVQAGQAGEDLARDQFDLSALTASSDMAAKLASLSEMARAGDIQAAQLLELVGRSNEARDQAGLDIAHEDFLRQVGYPMEQLQQISAMLHGLPIAPTGTSTTSVPYNPIQQALGMGISALGLYKGLT